MEQHRADSEMLTFCADASAAHAMHPSGLDVQMSRVLGDSCAMADALTGAVLCCSDPHLKA